MASTHRSGDVHRRHRLDSNKSITGAFFHALHSWTWIDSLPLRQSLMGIFLMLGFCTAAFGLLLYIKSWRLGMFRKRISAHQQHPLSRKIHRHLEASVAIFAMAFCLSDLFHLLVRDKSDQPQPTQLLAINAADLRLDMSALQRVLAQDDILVIQLARIGADLYWQLRKFTPPEPPGREHHHHHAHHAHEKPLKDAVSYINTTSGALLDQGWRNHVESLALAFSDILQTALKIFAW